MRRFPEEQLRVFRQEYRSGMSLGAIARLHGVSRSALSFHATRESWPGARRPSIQEQEKIASAPVGADDQVDRRLLARHSREWDLVRNLLACALQTGGVDAAEAAYRCAQTLRLIQDAEASLRGATSLGRLRDWSPGSATSHTEKRSPDLMALFDAYLRSRPTLAQNTVRAWRSTLERLAAFLAHRDSQRINRRDAQRWRDHLLSLGVAPATVKCRYMAAPRAVFHFAVNRGLIASNPFSNHRVEISAPLLSRGKGLTDQEAIIILKASDKLGQSGASGPVHAFLRWAPWLCAFTGARVTEIAQLRKVDLTCVKGIYVLHLTPDAGSIKTRRARRVPLHPQLVQLGFPAFVAGNTEGHLFGAQHTRKGVNGRKDQLGKWARLNGVSDLAVPPTHGWRHRFSTLCRECAIPLDVQAAIMGHSPQLTSERSYGEFTAAALYREIAKLPWIALD
jgi:integrase